MNQTVPPLSCSGIRLARQTLFIRQMAWFAGVGIIGFGVDLGVLEALVRLVNADPYSGRIASFFSAATTTWLLNRWLTFRRKDKPSAEEWFLYILLMAVGAFLNLGAYSLIIHAYGSTVFIRIIAVMNGTAAGMCVNFISARWVLDKAPLRKRSPP